MFKLFNKKTNEEIQVIEIETTNTGKKLNLCQNDEDLKMCIYGVIGSPKLRVINSKIRYVPTKLNRDTYFLQESYWINKSDIEVVETHLDYSLTAKKEHPNLKWFIELKCFSQFHPDGRIEQQLFIDDSENTDLSKIESEISKHFTIDTIASSFNKGHIIKTNRKFMTYSSFVDLVEKIKQI